MVHYKLLAFDLDGTALGSDPNVFSEGLPEAAAQAAAAGCIVAAATGRPAGCLPADVEKKPDWLSWLVLYDGAQIRNARTGECIWSKPFSAEALAQVQQAAARLGLPVEYIDRDSRYHMTAGDWQTLNDSGVSQFHKGVLARMGCSLDGPAADLAELEILKINMPIAPLEDREAFRTAVGEGVLVLDCGPGGLELTAPGAGKQTAVAFLAEQLGLGMEDVMALGDSGNDIALLSSAGLGVAMGNAPDDVKAAAKAVTGRNTEGGAAEAIRRWLLVE